VFTVFRQNVNMPCDVEAREVNEAEKLQVQVDSNSYVSVCMNSEHGTEIDVSDEQLQMKDNALTEVTNNTASEASQYFDQQYNSIETESADVGGNCAGVNGRHTNCTGVNNNKSGDERLSGFSATPVSKAVISHCRNNSEEHKFKKSASVSAELKVSKSSSSTVRQAPVELLPKPAYTLLPISVGVQLVVVVNAGTVQSSGDRTLLPTIAPRPASTASGNACVPEISEKDSSVVGRRDSSHGDLLLHRKQQKSVISVVTQTSSQPARRRCKTAAAATQTSEWFAPASRKVP